MTPDDRCAQFIEELSGSSPRSAACQEHLAGCPACREIAVTARALAGEASAYAPALTAAMTARVLSRLPLGQAATAAQATMTAAPTTGTAPGLWWALVTAGLVVAISGALWFAAGPTAAPPTPATTTAAPTEALPTPAGQPDPAGIVPPTELPPSEVPGLDGD
jgi:hypothetical protein